MFGQELKKMGIATAYRYIEKNPKDNLRKLMTWVDRIAGKGPDSFEKGNMGYFRSSRIKYVSADHACH